MWACILGALDHAVPGILSPRILSPCGLHYAWVLCTCKYVVSPGSGAAEPAAAFAGAALSGAAALGAQQHGLGELHDQPPVESLERASAGAVFLGVVVLRCFRFNACLGLFQTKLDVGKGACLE